MSGIAGVWMSGGAQRAVLDRIMAATAHRAVHGARATVSGDAALGHQLLDVAGEGPPMGGLATSGDCIVTADCRLDNREELVAALGSDPGAGDAELILAAYKRWDLEAPARLLGDFAFVLWDRARGRLLCVRDHFGVKPVYYHAAPQAFAVSSEQAGVLASGWPEPALNADSVAAFLAGLPPRPEATFYRDVARLPPAHLAILQHGRLEVRPYWRLEAAAFGDEDAAAGVRRRLELAVAARMRGCERVGAKLSGGLDSSTVACIAAARRRDLGNGPLPTFSMVFDDTPQNNERPQIETVLAAIEAVPHFLPCNDIPHLAELPDLLAQQHGPFIAPNLAASRRLCTAAAAAGVAVLLDGHGGDEVISSGQGRLTGLAAQRRWSTLWRELAQLQRNEAWPARAVFWGLFRSHARSAPLWRLLARARAKLGWSPRRAPQGPGPRRFLQTAFLERAEALQRETQASPPRGGDPAQAQHHATLTGPLQAYAMEILDKAAARAGVELRFPFWDKRLVEFCYAAPTHEKLRDGRTRALLRRSMTGILPEPIRTRPDKFNFMPHFLAGMTASPAPDALEAFPDAPGLEAFLDLPELRAAYERLQEDPQSVPPLEAQALWRCAAFACWWRLNLKDNSARYSC